MNCRAAQKFAFLVLFLLSCAGFASAQNKNQTTTDENIDVRISEERLSETNFERSTSVEAADAGKNVSVRVGVGVSAERMTVTLRGITATGRFRASLEKITRVIERARPEQ